MKYIILVLWTFSLFLLMFSSFPFRVECRPTRAMGPPRPSPPPVVLLPLTSSNANTYFNHHQHILTPCPVLEGPSAIRFNPWPHLYTPDITMKVWESPIVLEGTARSRSEVRPDGTFGVTFDLHRVVKGDAPLLRRRKQFRLQFLDNPNPAPDHNNRDRDFLSGPSGRRNQNINKNIYKNSTISSSSQLNPKSSSASSNNNNFNNVYNSHSNPKSSSSSVSRGGSSSGTSSLNTKQLHQPLQSSQAHQLQLYHQQQSRTLSSSSSSTTSMTTRQQFQPSRQSQQFRQSQQYLGRSTSSQSVPYFQNSTLGLGSQFQVNKPSSLVNSNNMNSRNLGGGGGGVTVRRSGRNAPSFGRSQQQPPSPGGIKCLPPKATVKTGRKYYVFAAKVENHFIAVFSPELANKRNTKAVESILCKGCGQAPSVVAAKDVQLNVKERLRLRCRLRVGNPIPMLTWYKDGRPVNLTDTRFRLRTKRRQSILVIRKASEIDVGVYRCEAKNVFGSAYASVSVSLEPQSGSESTTLASKPKSTTDTNSNPLSKRPPPSSNPVETTATTLWPLEAIECPKEFLTYCLNGGTCSLFVTIKEFVCQCAEGYKGQRCDTKDIASSGSMYLSYFCIFGTNNPDYPC